MEEARAFVLDVVLYQILPCFLVAAGVLMLAVSVFAARTTGAALALALGVLAGLWLRQLAPNLKDITDGSEALVRLPQLAWLALLDAPDASITWGRLMWLTLAALWLGRLARLPDLHPGAGWALRGGVCVAIAWLLLPSTERAETDCLAPVFAAVMFVLWAVLERLAEEMPGGGIAALLALVFLASAGIMVHAAILSYIELAIMFAATLAGLAAVASLKRIDVVGAMPGVAVLLPSLMLMGKLYSGVETLSWWVYALPVFAPLLLAETLPLKDGLPSRVFWLRTGLIVVVLAFALAMAHVQAGRQAVAV